MEQAPNSTPGTTTFDPADVKANSGIAALSYIGVLVLIPLLTKKDSAFAQAHAKQGLVTMIAMFGAVVPIIGWLWAMVVLVVNVIALVNALQGKFWEIPVAYELSKKFNI